MSSTVTLNTSQFTKGKAYEEKIVHAMIIDHEFCERMTDILEPVYFTQEPLQEIVNIIFAYRRKYDNFPSSQLIDTISSSELRSQTLKDAIKIFFMKIKKEPLNGDLEYIKETSLDFCRKKKLLRGIKLAAEMAETGKYDEVARSVQQALVSGAEKNIGHIYDQDIEKRYLPNIRNPVPTPWYQINSLLKGGAGSGELNVVMAPPNTGKSHILVALGANAVKMGHNVIHYTLEMADTQTGLRYDSNFANISNDDITKHKEEVRAKIAELQGKLIIKSYPTKSASVGTIRNHINRLKLDNFFPDMILVDYADLLRPGSDLDGRRFDLGGIYEELRAMAQEYDMPVWTASQPNRANAEKEVITLEAFSESYEKAMISDFVLSFSRTSQDISESTGTFFIAKNRNGKNKSKFLVTVDTSRSKFEILQNDDGEIVREIQNLSSSPQLSKELLKEKYKEFLKDRNIQQ